MKKETFLAVLGYMDEIDKFVDTLNEAGLEFFDTKCFDSICRIERILFENEYGTNGYEWIEWYLYDLPELKEKYPDQTFASEQDGTPIILNSREDLYEYLEKNYRNDTDNQGMA